MSEMPGLLRLYGLFHDPHGRTGRSGTAGSAVARSGQRVLYAGIWRRGGPVYAKGGSGRAVQVRRGFLPGTFPANGTGLRRRQPAGNPGRHFGRAGPQTAGICGH